MSTEQNVRTVKDFFAAMEKGDGEALLALVAEDIEWIIPGKDWPLAGTYRGRAGPGPADQDGVRVDGDVDGAPGVRRPG
jgi:ketosteroid isomerase-like protein